ncbi:hypothetical protein VTK26DRAFT_8715 [Humicola hyalothermophila]
MEIVSVRPKTFFFLVTGVSDLLSCQEDKVLTPGLVTALRFIEGQEFQNCSCAYADACSTPLQLSLGGASAQIKSKQGNWHLVTAHLAHGARTMCKIGRFVLGRRGQTTCLCF